MSEIRYSKFDDKYVIIAPNRFHKPRDINYSFSEYERINCPFCVGEEYRIKGEIFSIKEDSRWITRVVPNIYKALNLETEFNSQIKSSFESFGGFGMHEVIIDTPKHITLFDFSSRDYLYLLKTIKIRVQDLTKDIRIKYLSIFKNQGLGAGATQSHPHSQIVGMPILPTSKRDLLKREFKYYKRHGRKLLADIVGEEISEDKRVLFKSKNFISFMPYASLSPFEIMISSLDNSYSIINFDESRLDELSNILQKSINLLYKEIGEFDFNIEFFEPPINIGFDTEDFFDAIDRFHLYYIRIRPRVFNLAGFEVMNDMFINPIEPEFIKKANNC